MRRLFDAVTVQNIPHDAQMVAGYVDGHYQTVKYLEEHFPHARIVRITVTGNTLDAHVADVEPGDLTPQSGARWALRKVQAGQHPTLYCNTSTLPSVLRAVHTLGINPDDVSYWVAQYDGDPTIPHTNGAHIVAKQFTDRSHGRSLDESVVADYWPGVDPAPKPQTKPAPTPAPTRPTPTPTPTPKGKRMFIIRIKGTLPQFITDGITRRWIQDPAERQLLVAMGVVPDMVHDEDAAYVNRIPLVGSKPPA